MKLSPCICGNTPTITVIDFGFISIMCDFCATSVSATTRRKAVARWNKKIAGEKIRNAMELARASQHPCNKCIWLGVSTWDLKPGCILKNKGVSEKCERYSIK